MLLLFLLSLLMRVSQSLSDAIQSFFPFQVLPAVSCMVAVVVVVVVVGRDVVVVDGLLWFFDGALRFC